MIQQTILFNGFISALPQKEAMMAEPGQEGKRTREKPLSSDLGLKEQAGFGQGQPIHQRLLD